MANHLTESPIWECETGKVEETEDQGDCFNSHQVVESGLEPRS